MAVFASPNAKAAPQQTADGYTSAPAKHWTAPSWWEREAACIRSREGAWTSNTGNGFYGAYQFMYSTWRSAGGVGYPYLASPLEQSYRAYLVWKRDGGSWREWPNTSRACGLR